MQVVGAGPESGNEAGITDAEAECPLEEDTGAGDSAT